MGSYKLESDLGATPTLRGLRSRLNRFASCLARAALLSVYTATPVLAAPGDIVHNGQATQPNYVDPASAAAAGLPGNFMVPGFLFEPEVPFASLKEVPIWDELEQMLDNPYAITLDPATPGNDQGYPSYRTSIVRRPSFREPGTTLLSPGTPLPGLLVDPLNYNPTTGEEMRLLNSGYVGGPFSVPYQVYQDLDADPSGNTWSWNYRDITVSPGAGRVMESAIDYNSPIVPDPLLCVTNVELVPPEGTLLCGRDPGEPGYAGFGLLRTLSLRGGQYSTPALPLNGLSPALRVPGTDVTPGLGSGARRLYDPLRGYINPRGPAGGGGLEKPSLRVADVGGRPNRPNYAINVDPDNVTPSNENDYYRPAGAAVATPAGGIPTGRNTAIVLGKAMFWDMQVGSDGVQSCGTCHFSAGADTRSKNALNPNHLGGDLTFQIGDTGPVGNRAGNYELKLTDFPFHKLTNPDVAGDPACASPVVATVNGGVLENTPAASTGATGDVASGVTMTVCDAANVASDANDVASSMGVIYGLFGDIPTPGGGPGSGAFVQVPGMPNPVAPDIRGSTIDPIPAFQGLRRVEPRNTPTMISAGFNFDSFWDGRARHDFNGGSVFGAADPQRNVWVNDGGTLTPTRQMIKFASIASLATGPGLSEFEMSFQGRNWQKVAKKLLQRGVTPLANQLVDPDDSILGPYSGQRSTIGGAVDRPGRPGLNVTYGQLIRAAYFPQLWNINDVHLLGCYTDGNAALHPNQCSGTDVIPVLNPDGTVSATNIADPFDGYVLSGPLAGAADPADTNQFRQIEANFPLFWGLSIHAWVQILVPDDTPFDQFLDTNPDAFMALGEPGERGLVEDLLDCENAGQRNAPFAGSANAIGGCFTPWGNFKRDPNLTAYIGCQGEGGTGCTPVAVTGGTRQAGEPDPLLGMDIFFASNLSLKNPNFRTGRCGECHAVPTLTDHTVQFTVKAQLRDFASEFPPGQPGVEALIEPLGRSRTISGFLLESEVNETGQDAVERRIINQSIVPNPSDGLGYPDGLNNPDGTLVLNGVTTIGSVVGDSRYTGAGQSFFDNGVYNLGVRPIDEDIGRGGADGFGWPLSLAALMFKNLGGPDFEPGVPLSNFDPALGHTGGLFEESAQDQQINPGHEGDDVINPLAPAYLAPFINQLNVGDSQPELDEIFGGVNTLTDVPILEGFLDNLGPINPAGNLNEALNNGETDLMGTWPVVNRVGRNGSFKAAQLRNVEFTAPYFHNGGTLTLRQVVDFYTRGGDFPVTNAAHRDFNLVNMNVEVQSNLTEEEKVALVDFLLELTDDRVKYEMGPFDRPEVIIPLDGAAPDNTGGRPQLLADPTMYKDVPAVGAAGHPATPIETFLGLTHIRNNPNCDPTAGPISHYCR